MSEPVSLSDIKTHLRLTSSETGEDAYLVALMIAARRTIEAKLNRSIVDVDFTDDERVVVGQAIRLIVGSWYSNREGVITGTIVAELPFAIQWLLKPLAKISTP